MSHIYRKIRYVVQGGYGSTDEAHILVHFDLSSDHVLVYDEKGDYLISWGEWASKGQMDLSGALKAAIDYDEEKFETLSDEDWVILKSKKVI